LAEVRRHTLDARRDERGWVVNPLAVPDPGDALGHVHVASLAPGAVRGNHVHPDSAEYVLVWGGRAELAWESADGGLAVDKVGQDQLVVYEIPPGVAHAVTNTGDTEIYLMAYYFGPGEEEWPGTQRKRLV
jgi:oxalate decarboxylase/phosphoglucose isomerase-like protein (cupin superfamily)